MEQHPTKIRFIQTCSSERACYVRGREFDLPPDVAAGFVRAGHAVAVEPIEPAKAAEARTPDPIEPTPPASTTSPAVKHRRK